MGRTRGRHAAPRRQPWIRIAAVVVAAGIVAGGAYAVTRDTDSTQSNQSAEGSRSASSSAATSTAGSSCAQTLSVWTGNADDRLVDRLASSSRGTCVRPAANAASANLSLDTRDPGSGALVGVSPVVLAVPSDLASAFGPADKDNLGAWMRGSKTWAKTGHTDMGEFRIVADDPATSPTSALGYGALVTTVNGGPPSSASDYTNLTPETLAVMKVEHRMTGTSTLMSSRRALGAPSLAAFGKQGSVVLTTEREVRAHNAGDPTVRFTALPLLGGAMAAPVIADDQRGTAATQLVKHLSSSSGAAQLDAAGWKPVPGSAEGTASSMTAMLKQIRAGWATAHRRTSTLVLVDMSGSMNGRFVDSGRSKIDQVRALVGPVYQASSPESASTIWFFQTENGKPVLERPHPLRLNKTPVNGKPHSTAVTADVQKATAEGGTPLYWAVRKAFEHTQDNYRPGYLNQVLVLSDGANTDAGTDYSLKDLVSYLRSNFDPKRPVSVSSILLAPRANGAQMREVSDATKGFTVPVTSTADLKKILTTANFT